MRGVAGCFGMRRARPPSPILTTHLHPTSSPAPPLHATFCSEPQYALVDCRGSNLANLPDIDFHFSNSDADVFTLTGADYVIGWLVLLT